MPRDPLAVLARLREAAVTEASRALASAHGTAHQLTARLEAHTALTLHEQSHTPDMDGATFAAWLQQARHQAHSLRQLLSAEEARAARLLQALVVCRTEAEAVAKALGRQRAAAVTLAARHQQQAMDEASATARRRSGR